MSELEAELPGMPRDEAGPVFCEPWEAQAFALTFALHRGGVFQWSEWVAMLAEEIGRAQAAGDPDTGSTYYRHWLAALERMIAGKGISDAQAIERCSNAWMHAARRTPHGTPIELVAADFQQ